MKLQSYQLCRWCDRTVHGRRRWLWLAGNVLLLLLGRHPRAAEVHQPTDTQGSWWLGQQEI